MSCDKLHYVYANPISQQRTDISIAIVRYCTAPFRRVAYTRIASENLGIECCKLHYVYGLNNQGRESSRRRCTSYGKASEVQRLPYGVVIWQQDLSQ